MKVDKKTYELIESYNSGELSAEEKHEVELQMSQNEDFAKQVKIHALADDVIIDQALLSLKDKMQQYKDADHGRQSSSNWKNLLLAGGAIVLIGLSIWWFNDDTSNHLPKNEQKEQENEIVNSSQLLIKENLSNTLPNETKEEKEVIKTKSVPALKSKAEKKELAIRIEDTREEKIKTLAVKKMAKQLVDHKPIKPIKITEKTDYCKGVSFKASTIINDACNQLSDGSIEINKQSISGGQSPYLASIDETKSFENEFSYHNLLPGKYKLYIKDANGCVSALENEFIVKEKICINFQEFSFNPYSGESWKLPIEHGQSGELTIFSQSGEDVYKSKIGNGSPYEWNGKRNNQSTLPQGSYTFIIKLNDQKDIQGQITLQK